MATLKKTAAAEEQTAQQTVTADLPDAHFTPTSMYRPSKKVQIELFKDDYRYKEPLFVGINGRTWLIPRGKPVEVDDYVADFIEAQKSEEARIMRRVEAEEAEYNKTTAEMGK